MVVDLGLWNALLSTATLLVVAGTAVAALRQIRHLRAQNTLNGLLKVLDDWRDPAFMRDAAYVRSELPAKLQEPGFLDDFDTRVDRAKHPELNICDWYEQLGNYVKHGLLDERIMMDVSAASVGRMWDALEPVIARMRKTRGDATYENFEYLAARGVLFQRKHPAGCYPSDTPRMAALRETRVDGIVRTRLDEAAPEGS